MGTGTIPTYESVSQWGVWCKDIPFQIADGVKKPASRTWNDEHGDDEYIASTGMFMEAYTMEVEFGCKVMKAVTDGQTNIPAVTDVQKKVADFLEYLRSSGMMKMYSSYTRIGRQYVRLESYNDGTWQSKKEWRTVNNVRTLVTTEEFLVFKIKFKVNDPVTNIIYSSGQLIEDTGGSGV